MFKNIRNVFLAVGLTVLASPAISGIIDFEAYSKGTIIDTEYLPDVQIRGFNVDRNKDNMAVVFDTGDYSGGDDDLESPFTNPFGNLGIYDPGNVLIIHENAWTCDQTTCDNPDDEGSRPAGFFEFVFNEEVSLNSIDFFDIEYAESHMPMFEIELFSDNNFANAIYDDAFFVPETGGDNTWDRLFFDNVSGVQSMRINLGGSGAIDNINYSTSVPEPSTLAAFSLVLLSLVRLRKK